jgi:Zn-finger nucleic acid-binding protein
MRPNEFEVVDRLSDVCDEAVSNIIASTLLDEVKKKMAEAMEQLPEGFSLNFNLGLTVFENQHVAALPMLQRGITCGKGVEPYPAWGDSSVHRYMVNGEIAVVPHDHCPHCWGEWDNKFEIEMCPHCGFSMGEQVKLLLDNDTCPNCDTGKVSRSQPKCNKCGYTVDGGKVVWG